MNLQNENMCNLLKNLLPIALAMLLINQSKAQEINEEIVTYKVIAPSQIKKGKLFSINVLFKVQPNWYIYAADGNNAVQGKIETKVNFTSDQGLFKLKNIQIPEAVFKDGQSIYQGDSILISQQFNVVEHLASGRYEIKGKIIYQTCNSEICLPPITEEVITVVNLK